MNRNTRTIPSVDESYHENSKWTPRTVNIDHIALFNEGLGSFSSPEVTYQYVVDPGKGLYRNLGSMPETIQILFQELRKRTSQRLNYYAIVQADAKDEYSLFCYTKGYEDIPDYFVLERVLSATEIRRLLEEIWVLDPKRKSEIPEIESILFIVGNLAASQVVFGLRAYRTLLIESGYAACIAQSLIEKVSKNPVLTTSFFHDNALNELLNIDGLEFSVLNVVLVGRRQE